MKTRTKTAKEEKRPLDSKRQGTTKRNETEEQGGYWRQRRGGGRRKRLGRARQVEGGAEEKKQLQQTKRRQNRNWTDKQADAKDGRRSANERRADESTRLLAVSVRSLISLSHESGEDEKTRGNSFKKANTD